MVITFILTIHILIHITTFTHITTSIHTTIQVVHDIITTKHIILMLVLIIIGMDMDTLMHTLIMAIRQQAVLDMHIGLTFQVVFLVT